MLIHATGTLAPDGFGKFDALHGIIHGAMCTQTIQKQFLMSRQRFKLHSDRFHRKKCFRVIENVLHQAADTLAHDVFSNSDTHLPWNRLKFT